MCHLCSFPVESSSINFDNIHWCHLFITSRCNNMFVFSSIEYWPDPQRGIKEAYRVLTIGGVACLIGPVYPTFWLSRFFADVWMLFPKEEEYIEWFKKAGFTQVKLKRIGPKWYRGVRRHGLIMGCSVTGVKPYAGESPLQVGTSLFPKCVLLLRKWHI